MKDPTTLKGSNFSEEEAHVSTYTQIMYHIVFSTKNRERVFEATRRRDLYRIIWGVIKNHNGHLYRIGGTDDHIHILSDLHPNVKLAEFIKDIKLGSSDWIKRESVFPMFTHWQEGYGAFTKSWQERERIVQYIMNQEEHHKTMTFTEELMMLLKEAGIEFDEKYLN